MTHLIAKQLYTIGTMIFCGIACGIAYGAVSYIAGKVKNKTFAAGVIALGYLLDGYLFGAFLYFCNNGKISLTALGAFLLGLLLWRKNIYGTI